MNHRHLARDDEAEPHRSEAMIHLAMINLMTRRIAAESALSPRGTWKPPGSGNPGSNMARNASGGAEGGATAVTS